MPIKVAAAPKSAMKMLETGIKQHLAAGLVDATLGQVESMAAPHRVFHLGLDALVGEKPIAQAAKHVGWPRSCSIAGSRRGRRGTGDHTRGAEI